MTRAQLPLAGAGGSGVFAKWLEKCGDILWLPMNEADFRSFCTNDLRQLIGHTSMLATVGHFSAKDRNALYALNLGCPPDLFERMTSNVAVANHPTLIQWLQTQQPLFIVSGTGSDRPVEQELATQGLGCRAIHGIVDGGGATGTCFAFFGLMPEKRDAVVSALRFAVPYLHVALMRLRRQQTMKVARNLTERERQLILLVVDGQSNPQIAKEWNRSVMTVRNLLHGLMGKLNVSNRARLAVVAIQMGLLDAGIPIPPA